MEEKKFYNKIQERIDQNDFDFDWNQEEIWQRIEQKNQKKTPFLTWWKAAAASIVLLGGIGLYFSGKNTQIADNQVVKKNKVIAKSQNIALASTKFAQQVSVKKAGVLQGFESKKVINKIPEIGTLAAIIEPQIIEKSDGAKQETSLIEEKTVVTNEPSFLEKSSTFVANPAILEVRIPKKKERIAILEIPEDDETYAIQKKEKRKNYAARMARKMNKTTDELPSINGKPNKVWAFVKESFKNEIMAADSVK